MNNLVSVIIPVYNCEQYLIDCVNSVLNQNYDQIEIILVDDGSTDGSGRLCDELAKKHNNIFVFHNENMGVSFSRNFGITKSRGEYLIFIDADDYVDNTFIDKLVNKLSPEVDISFCRFSIDFSDNKKTYFELNLEKFVKKPNDFTPLLVNEQYKSSDTIIETDCVFGSVCRCAFKKEIILKNHLTFNTNIVLGEDLLFLCDYLVYVKKAKLIDQYLYFYRKNQKSAVSTKSNGYIESFVEINYPLLKEKIRIIQKNDSNTDLIDYLNMKFAYAFAVNELKLSKEKTKGRLSKFYKDHSELTFRLKKVKKFYKFSFKRKILLFLLKHQMWNVLKLLLR